MEGIEAFFKQLFPPPTSANESKVEEETNGASRDASLLPESLGFHTPQADRSRTFDSMHSLRSNYGNEQQNLTEHSNTDDSPWKLLTDKEGKPYYFNVETKAVSWSDPNETLESLDTSAISQGGERPPWDEAQDANTGRTYFYHRHTKQVTWHKPPDLEEWEQKMLYRKRQAKAERAAQQKKEKEDEARRAASVGFVGRLLGKKPPTKEEEEAELRRKEEDEELERQVDIAMRPYKEGRHHVKFNVGGMEAMDDPPYDVYEGEFHSYKFHGKGKYVHANGETYEGDWFEGKQHGQGFKTWPDGQTYRGEYRNDDRCGQGEMSYADGTLYTGEWKANLWDGAGRVRWKPESGRPGSYAVTIGEDGEKVVSWGVCYQGEFKEGKKHGKGEMQFQDKSSYNGDWEADRYHGRGKYVFANGDTYDGEWMQGVPHGQGKQWIDEVKEVYEGQFEYGQRQGVGKLTVKTGWSWKGSFIDGKKSGKGTHVSPEGEKFFGEWWQHAWTRNELPPKVAQTVIATYALHEDNFGTLFQEEYKPEEEKKEKKKSGFLSMFGLRWKKDQAKRDKDVQRDNKPAPASILKSKDSHTVI